MAVDLEKLQTVLRNKLSEKFGDKVLGISEAFKEVTIQVDREIIRELCFFLRDDPDFKFDLLAYATAVDESALGRTPRYQMAYNLYSVFHKHRVRVKAGVPEEDPRIDSVEPVWKTANWLERETFDMFGILFDDHPDLRRILMPDDWIGHPLRKDFPLGGVKSFYFKRDTNPRAGEPKTLIPRIREQLGDI